MCIWCDLNKQDEDGERARTLIEDIHKTCETVTFLYRQLKRGNIKPHTKEMDKLVLSERHLIRLLIMDVL
jgi:hypothetical protein